jgi:DnaK suppressor protein
MTDDTAGPAPDPTARLLAVRADLQARADAIRSGAHMPSGGISFGKRVGEGTSIAIERFADVAIHDQILGQIDAVDAALTRCSEGAYGTCTACGRTMPAERLDAIPWAATCVACS